MTNTKDFYIVLGSSDGIIGVYKSKIVALGEAERYLERCDGSRKDIIREWCGDHNWNATCAWMWLYTGSKGTTCQIDKRSAE
mgnify:FL=1